MLQTKRWFDSKQSRQRGLAGSQRFITGSGVTGWRIVAALEEYLQIHFTEALIQCFPGDAEHLGNLRLITLKLFERGTNCV